MLLLNKRIKHAVSFLLFLLLSVTVYRSIFSRTDLIRAQESGSISLTPSPIASAIPDIPKINLETLRDPSAFKLDQQIKQATREFFNSLEKNELSTTLENKASQRKNLMKQAIQKYPYVFLGNVLTSSQTSSFDAKLQPYFEESIALSGVELGVTHYDDFKDHKNSRFDYSLQNLQEHKRFNFYPAASPNKQDDEEAFGGHISGTILNVNGVVLDDDVSARVVGAPQGGGENNDPVVTNVEILKEASPDALGPQRVAVILVREKGSTFTPYYSKEQIEEMIFRGDVQKFFKEASYDKMWLDEEKSKVYGWYEMEGLDIYPLNAIRKTTIQRNTITIADNDIDFTQFDRIMMGSSVKTDTNNGWGTVGKYTQTTDDGDTRLSFHTFGVDNGLLNSVAHESGHNFGVNHANLWECSEGSLKGSCQHLEYGNPFDTMGYGYLRHFNAYFKEVFQWLNKPVVNITSSGKYILQPLEYPEAVVAKISWPVGASNFPIYYLEARASVGFDDDTNDPKFATRNNKISGIHVNWVNKPLETRFLTLNPPINRDGLLEQREPLRRGQILRDAKSGVTITNIDDMTVNVDLEEPSCTYDDLDVDIDNIYIYEYKSGDLVDMICDARECIFKRKKEYNNDLFFTFLFRVENKNSSLCPDVRIRILLKDPWKIRPELSQDTRFLAGGVVNILSSSTMIPQNISAGTYGMSVVIENIDDNKEIFSTSRDLKIVDEISSLEGDLNNDQKVDIFDLVTVARDFGKKGEGFAGDANRDGDVNIFDLVIVAKNFGKEL